MSTKTQYLSLSWSVSRGRDTYGYNICRLDAEGYYAGAEYVQPKRYKCSGGGYNMTGTVVGQWLQDRHQDRLMSIKDRFDAWQGAAHGKCTAPLRERLYGGLYYFDKGGRVELDGGCGLSSMEAIAEAIGLSMTATVNRKGHTTGFIVTAGAAED